MHPHPMLIVENLKLARRRYRGLRTRARRSYRRTKARVRRAKMTVPIAPIIGLGVGLLGGPAGTTLMDHVQAKDWRGAVNRLSQSYLGYSPGGGGLYPGEARLTLEEMKYGLLPLVMGGLVHKFVGGDPVGINRILGRAKVPLVRI